MNIRDTAKDFVSITTKNIADLGSVSVDLELQEESFMNAEGKEVRIKVAVVDGTKYRVPMSVIRDLKAILEVKPKLKAFKVLKQGTGMNTTYITMPLE